MAVPSDRTPKRVISTRLGLAIVLLPLSLVGLQMLFESESGCACGSPSDRGRYGIVLIRAMQIEYREKYGTFAESLPMLQQTTALQIPSSYTQSFQFSVEANSERAVIDAIPLSETTVIDRFHLGLRTLKFRSIVGVTAFHNGEYISILCESEQPTTAKPPEPRLIRGQFTCPANFNQI
ncbi:MAG: type IV pilin-like G/H family protein [Oculatellaceae cyanobacterium bins.114]|nr:type IV pilin-like G/H family protein [Oculatellaceae cyanobacterium bins.114]